MPKIQRIRDIIENNTNQMLSAEYDNALIGIHYTTEHMIPVYTYLALIEAHMDYHRETEEASLKYIEDYIMTNPAFIIVDDTGV